MTSWRDQYPKSFLKNENETTPEKLLEALRSTKPLLRPMPGFEGRVIDVYDRLSYGVDCDEVYPNILIGDSGAARDKAYLKRIGITHVLNTAEGSRFGMVNTNVCYYLGTGINYMGIQLLDLPVTNISIHFNATANFIDEALRNGGKILVHCLVGMSRSSTCVLSYLMLKKSFTAAEAVRKVRSHRDIRPNDGFLQQLADLDNKLQRERGRM